MLSNLAIAIVNSFRRRAPPGPPPRTVAAVDLQRYLGLWYEAGRLPNPEQDGGRRRCVDVTATYAMRADGSIDVRNQARDAGTRMRPRGIHGRARPVDGSGAKLRVTFFGLFGGPYWVLGLAPDYRWALVGSPSRRRLWVLSRTPAMEAADYEEALRIAAAEGYDAARVVRTPQAAAG